MLVIGVVSGYFAGKIIKKISGMALTIGIIIFFLITFAYTGAFNLNLESINANLINIYNYLATLGIIALISSIPFVASFIAGLFIGFRRY